MNIVYSNSSWVNKLKTMCQIEVTSHSNFRYNSQRPSVATFQEALPRYSFTQSCWMHPCKSGTTDARPSAVTSTVRVQHFKQVLWVVVLTKLRNERYFNDMRRNSQKENPLSPSHHRRHTPCFSPAPMSTAVPSVFPHARAPSSALLSNVAFPRGTNKQYSTQTYSNITLNHLPTIKNVNEKLVDSQMHSLKIPV